MVHLSGNHKIQRVEVNHASGYPTVAREEVRIIRQTIFHHESLRQLHVHRDMDGPHCNPSGARES